MNHCGRGIHRIFYSENMEASAPQTLNQHQSQHVKKLSIGNRPKKLAFFWRCALVKKFPSPCFLSSSNAKVPITSRFSQALDPPSSDVCCLNPQMWLVLSYHLHLRNDVPRSRDSPGVSHLGPRLVHDFCGLMWLIIMSRGFKHQNDVDIFGKWWLVDNYRHFIGILTIKRWASFAPQQRKVSARFQDCSGFSGRAFTCHQFPAEIETQQIRCFEYG